MLARPLLLKRVLPNMLAYRRVPSMRLLLISFGFLPFFRLGYQAPRRNLLLSWLMRTWILSEVYLQLTDGAFLQMLVVPCSGTVP